MGNALALEPQGFSRQLHGDVILLYLPESFSFLFSCANKGYYILHLSGIDNLNKKAKTK